MRAIILAVLLLAGCADRAAETTTSTSHEAPPIQTVERTLLDQAFEVRSGETGMATVEIPEGTQQVSLTVNFGTRATTRLTFHGLGGCDGYDAHAFIGVGAGGTTGKAKDCGRIPAGPVEFTWDTDGYVDGTIIVKADVAAPPAK